MKKEASNQEGFRTRREASCVPLLRLCGYGIDWLQKKFELLRWCSISPCYVIVPTGHLAEYFASQVKSDETKFCRAALPASYFSCHFILLGLRWSVGLVILLIPRRRWRWMTKRSLTFRSRANKAASIPLFSSMYVSCCFHFLYLLRGSK